MEPYTETDDPYFSDNPEDYYFWLENDIDGIRRFSITPKEHYDEENCLLDTELEIDSLLYENGMMSICDSTFEYNGSPEEGMALLLKLGLTEKQMHW